MFEIIALSEKFGTCLTVDSSAERVCSVCHLGMFHLIFLCVYPVWSLGGGRLGCLWVLKGPDQHPCSEHKAVSQSARSQVCLFSFKFARTSRAELLGSPHRSLPPCVTRPLVWTHPQRQKLSSQHSGRLVPPRYYPSVFIYVYKWEEFNLSNGKWKIGAWICWGVLNN